VQKKWFERQLLMAKEVKLPVIIHSRDAAKDTLDMMQSLHAEEAGGVIHCFSYTKEMAREYLDMDFYFGIGGVVTFKNSKKLKEAVAYIPLEKIVLETDSPYLAPEPNRGKRNSSLNLPYVAKEIAAIKGIDYDEVLAVTHENAGRLFSISSEDKEA
jgi:TatD DNase family protein